MFKEVESKFGSGKQKLYEAASRILYQETRMFMKVKSQQMNKMHS